MHPHEILLEKLAQVLDECIAAGIDEEYILDAVEAKCYDEEKGVTQ